MTHDPQVLTIPRTPMALGLRRRPLCCNPLPGINRVGDVHHKDGALGVRVQPVPDDAAPGPAFVGVSRTRGQRPSAFWAALGCARVHVRVWGVSDVLRAWHGIAVLVLLDEHRQPTEPELLVPCALMPVCRSMYMSVQTTRINSRPEPCLLISPPWPLPALSCSGWPNPWADSGR